MGNKHERNYNYIEDKLQEMIYDYQLLFHWGHLHINRK